jgi:hypothetical protein
MKTTMIDLILVCIIPFFLWVAPVTANDIPAERNAETDKQDPVKMLVDFSRAATRGSWLIINT